ncbi:inositol monophosphatase [Aureimonas altamirensis]|uniref:Inositol monophosphatase n=1 Tax=Aureimonas altamirensis TaxID=370622 RepID=A0A0B1Q2G6_9HYPH|nr:inositol monophosphatase family protein [Aureimonas altamirensis]KHJ55013.1 inositol monophosphatase [Aureimonas altamirensis]
MKGTLVTQFDTDRLADILRQAARSEIMPRFRRLSAGDIREKTSAVDLVTEADEAAERAIEAACRQAFPDAAFVGEEGVAANAALLDKVAGADLAIVVDPIDGTANFASGAPMFGVMAAVVRKGETIAGVIHDPLGDDAMVGEKGGGVFFKSGDEAAKRLRYAEPVPLADMVGAAATSQLPLEQRRRTLAGFGETRILSSFRSAAQEYRLALSGALHYLYYVKLMPWDHLAGAMMCQEAGAFVRRLDGSVYRPGHVAGGLLVAPDEAGWHDLRTVIG